MNATIYEYQIEYPRMTKQLYENDRKIWDAVMLRIRIQELDKGFYLRKANKPQKKGAVLTFRACKDVAEWEKEMEKLKEDAKKIGYELSVEEKKGDGGHGES